MDIWKHKLELVCTYVPQEKIAIIWKSVWIFVYMKSYVENSKEEEEEMKEKYLNFDWLTDEENERRSISEAVRYYFLILLLSYFFCSLDAHVVQHYII